MTVYRIQNAQGRGPFKPGLPNRWVRMRDDLANLHPWPMEFGLRILNFAGRQPVGCGCQTIAQLQRWFIPREYRKLLRLGYRAVTLDECTIIAASEIQCVFFRSKPLTVGAVALALYTVDAPAAQS